MNQSELEANSCSRRQTRENACRQVAIGFGFTSDWPKKWREIFYPIANNSNTKPKQLRNYFRHSIENYSVKELCNRDFDGLKPKLPQIISEFYKTQGDLDPIFFKLQSITILAICSPRDLFLLLEH